MTTIDGSARIAQRRQKHRRNAEQRPTAAKDGDWSNDQQDPCQAGYDPDKLTWSEGLFGKQKVRQYRNHQRDRRLQHGDYGTVDPADCRGSQNVCQPAVGGPENDHVT